MTIQEIARRARSIAGAVYDDASGTIEQKIAECLCYQNNGTDGDLTSDDRDELEALLNDAIKLNS